VKISGLKRIGSGSRALVGEVQAVFAEVGRVDAGVGEGERTAEGIEAAGGHGPGDGEGDFAQAAGDEVRGGALQGVGGAEGDAAGGGGEGVDVGRGVDRPIGGTGTGCLAGAGRGAAIPGAAVGDGVADVVGGARVVSGAEGGRAGRQRTDGGPALQAELFDFVVDDLGRESLAAGVVHHAGADGDGLDHADEADHEDDGGHHDFDEGESGRSSG